MHAIHRDLHGNALGTAGAMKLAMIRKLTVCALVAFAAACSSAPENLGQSNARIDYICSETASATLDGIPAYAYCGNFNVWSNNGADTKSASGGAGWVQTEGGYGYQCVEYAVRYTHFKFGTSTSWGIGYAKEMCATHPSGISETTSPIHGDLVVFTPGTCGVDATAGHVAVVDTLTSSTVSVVQENVAGKYTYNKTCVRCFLHEASNNGTSDPCSAAPANGYFCGQSTQFGPGGIKDDLYDCVGGATSSKVACPDGCIVEPPGTNDKCAPVPADAGSDGSPGDAAPTSDAAAQEDDASLPPPKDDAGTNNTSGSNGCSSSPRGTSSDAWLLALAFGALATRRRAKR